MTHSLNVVEWNGIETNRIEWFGAQSQSMTVRPSVCVQFTSCILLLLLLVLLHIWNVKIGYDLVLVLVLVFISLLQFKFKS